MKMIRFAVCQAFVFIMAASALFAQEDQSPAEGLFFSESELYVVHIPIERVFAHPKGYIVEYRKTALVNKKVYLPLSWFVINKDNPGPLKGEVVLLGPGKAWPHLSVYYKEGAISHVRLHVRKETGHFTWGNVTPNPEIEARFDEENVKIEFK